MEEDIEILNHELANIRNLIDYYTYENLDYDKKFRMEKFKKALENLIARNKKLEKQMGKDLDVVYLQGVYNERDRWKSKVEEKIEEIEKRNVPHELDFKAFYRIEDLKRIEIGVLKDLLPERDK